MNTLVKEIKSRFLSILNNPTLKGDIQAAFLYGGNIKFLKKTLTLQSPEIDLLIVVTRNLAPGEPPVPHKILAEITNGLKYNNKKFILIYNGVAPESYEGNEYLIDVIGDGIPNIQHKDPSAIVVSYKPRLLIYGKDLYTELSNIPFTKNMRNEMLKVMSNYIRREFYKRQDRYAITALSKNSIFIASLFSQDTLKTNDKDLIVQKISILFPELKPLLIKFQKAYHNPDSANKLLLNNYFDNLCEQLKELESLES